MPTATNPRKNTKAGTCSSGRAWVRAVAPESEEKTIKAQSKTVIIKMPSTSPPSRNTPQGT
jgi:hypothetical protein